MLEWVEMHFTWFWNELGGSVWHIQCYAGINIVFLNEFHSLRLKDRILKTDCIEGQPLYNCIVWLDNRTSDIVDTVLDNIPGRDLNWLKKKTGLPISTYFTAFKLKWLIHNDPRMMECVKNDQVLVGTVDSWLLWKLTGEHKTDVTNASRTLLMDIETLEWDPVLCHFFEIPMKILPEIKPSSDFYGHIKIGPLEGKPITGWHSIFHI